ncbi:MAG: RNA-binding protein [Bacteroidetes bacterium]|jgi:RNA recognition motif-containing protein|nr:RNA-binding protein [Bacteroidota bacterium]
MNLYIGNLSYATKDNDLKALFEEIGEVSSAKIIMDRISGRSKGFGFVEMPNDDEARKAIENLNGYSFNNREITVSEARPRPEGGDRR